MSFGDLTGLPKEYLPQIHSICVLMFLSLNDAYKVSNHERQSGG